MQKAQDIEAALPDPLLLADAGPHTFRILGNGLPNSLSTVLSHEIIKFNRLLDVMRTTLALLQKAIQGLTVLSESLDAMFTSFLNNEVPLLWSEVAYPSLKPLSGWFKDFLERVAFIRLWLRKGVSPLPSLWLSLSPSPSAYPSASPAASPPPAYP